MKDNIILFNHWHYGDVFLSRIFINALKDHFNFIYHHTLKTPLFFDIDNLIEINNIPSNFKVSETYPKNRIINTWIGQQNHIYNKINKGCSFENYINIIEDTLHILDIPIKNSIEYLPSINYEKIPQHQYIIDLIKYFKQKFKKIILICNGNVDSGQAPNFNFDPIVYELSNDPDCLFLLTSKTNLIKNNIIYTCDITNKKPDLIEISFISTFCDIIVGRSSGPYTCSLNKENILNPNKIFISFNNNEIEARYINSDLMKAKVVFSKDYSYNNILKQIQNQI